MNEFYRNEIERVQNSYKVTTNERGEVSIEYVPYEEEEGYNINKILDCLEQNRRSFSLITAIYNYFTKKKPVSQEPPCTMAFDWINQQECAFCIKN